MRKGILYVVSGPSGAGKGTVMQHFLPRHPGMFYSISATTRAPRVGEEDGVNYYFMEKDDFLRLRSADGFLECAEFCGNFYGTPKEAVMEKLSDAGFNGDNLIPTTLNHGFYWSDKYNIVLLVDCRMPG